MDMRAQGFCLSVHVFLFCHDELVMRYMSNVVSHLRIVVSHIGELVTVSLYLSVRNEVNNRQA
jgi:hypothetical protein